MNEVFTRITKDDGIRVSVYQDTLPLGVRIGVSDDPTDPGWFDENFISFNIPEAEDFIDILAEAILVAKKVEPLPAPVPEPIKSGWTVKFRAKGNPYGAPIKTAYVGEAKNAYEALCKVDDRDNLTWHSIWKDGICRLTLRQFRADPNNIEMEDIV